MAHTDLLGIISDELHTAETTLDQLNNQGPVARLLSVRRRASLRSEIESLLIAASHA